MKRSPNASRWLLAAGAVRAGGGVLRAHPDAQRDRRSASTATSPTRPSGSTTCWSARCRTGRETASAFAPAFTASRSATPATTRSSRRSSSRAAATSWSTRSCASCRVTEPAPPERGPGRERRAKLSQNSIWRGTLYGREVARAVVDDVLGAAHAGADDARDDHRAAQVVGDDAGLRRLDLGERLQAALDLAQRDALAVDLDQVVLAAGDGEAAVLVELAEIAGAEPAVRADAADRRRRRRAWAGASSAPPAATASSSATQIGPTSLAATRSPLAPATRSSTPSNARPTVSGSLPARSIASGPAWVPW